MRDVGPEELAKQNERLVSDETPYWVIKSVLCLLQIIYDFMCMISNLPSISYDCSKKLLDILKVRHLLTSRRPTTRRRATWCWERGRCS